MPMFGLNSNTYVEGHAQNNADEEATICSDLFGVAQETTQRK